MCIRIKLIFLLLLTSLSSPRDALSLWGHSRDQGFTAKADDWVFSLKARMGLGDRSHPSSFDKQKRKPSVSCRVQLDTQISAAILLPHHGVAQYTVLLLWDLETPEEHPLGYHISDIPEKGEIFVSNVELIGELSTEESLELDTPFLAHLDCPP